MRARESRAERGPHQGVYVHVCVHACAYGLVCRAEGPHITVFPISCFDTEFFV